MKDPTGREVNFDSYFDAPENVSPLDTFSEVMFKIKWTDQVKYGQLMARPEFQKFMVLEEDELTPELETELVERLEELGFQDGVDYPEAPDAELEDE